MFSRLDIAESALAVCTPAAISRKQIAINELEQRLLQIWDGASTFATGFICAYAYKALQSYEPMLSPPPEGFIPIAMRISLIGGFIAPVVFQRVRTSDEDANWTSMIRQVAVQLAVLISVLLTIGFSMRALIYVPRTWASMWSIAIGISIFGSRLLTVRLQTHVGSHGIMRRKVVIAGTTSAADALDQHLRSLPKLDAEVVKVFRDDNELAPLRHCLTDLIDYGKRHPVDCVLLAPGEITDADLLGNAVNQLKALSVEVVLSPSIFGGMKFQPEFVHVGGVPFVRLASRPLDHGALILKGIEDKVLAALLLVLFTPIMVAVAIAIRLDSRGPVFFRQQRHGLNNTEFEILKFRTMKSESDAPGQEVRQTQRSDVRLTRVGRFLRKSSLDELPQLLNVLRGDMSLVGPRPHPITMRTEGCLGPEIVANYSHRHQVKPGITGWAQVNGSRGATKTIDQVRQRVEFDMFYIERWSFFLDLKIIALTPLMMFTKRDNAF